MGSQENQPNVTASMVLFQPERGKNKVVEGEADVNKKSPRESDEVIEIITKNFDSKEISQELKVKIGANLNKRMTLEALRVKNKYKIESKQNIDSEKFIKNVSDGPSK